MAVAIIAGEDDEPLALERWFSEDADIRNNPEVGQEVLGFIEKYGVKSVTMTDGIIGCPHEEGVDYKGPTCPMCPFWANRDRWTGEVIH